MVSTNVVSSAGAEFIISLTSHPIPRIKGRMSIGMMYLGFVISICFIPVSYTHLDVYKRQTNSLITNGSIAEPSSFWYVWLVSITIYFLSLYSYLADVFSKDREKDVYKRQASNGISLCAIVLGI